MSTQTSLLAPSSDRPIASHEEDRLSRSAFATALANELASSRLHNGYVVGLVGPWGSGKTSLLNMIDEQLRPHDDVVIVRFNPWLFSGTEQLLLHFFRETVGQLKLHKAGSFTELGNQIETFGKLVGPFSTVPVAGGYAAGTAKGAITLGGFLKRRSPIVGSAEEQKKKIGDSLRKLNKKVIILVDDIDRLQDDEIQVVMRLVRLVADFPNTSYVLAFDRQRVEESLRQAGGDGRAYLEKILQAVHHVPETRQPDIGGLLIKGINEVIKDREVGPLDDVVFQNVFHFVLRPLFKTVRDVRRYCNSISSSVEVIGEEVCLGDLLALEASRVFMPDSWEQISGLKHELTGTAKLERVDRDNNKIKDWIAKAGDHGAVLKGLCNYCFLPSGRYISNTTYGSDWNARWSRERRVSHMRILDFYLEKSYPTGTLSGKQVSQLFTALGNGSDLAKLFGALNPAEVEDAFERLEDFEDDFGPEQAISAIPVIYAQWPRLREGVSASFYDMGVGIKVSRIVLRLLRGIDDPTALAETVRTLLPQLDTYSAKLDVVGLIGHVEGAGHKLVEQVDAEAIEQDLKASMFDAKPEELRSERELLRVLLWFAKDNKKGHDRILKWMEDDRLFVRLLKVCVQDVRSQGLGDAAVSIQPRLSWSTLIDLLGDEYLTQRLNKLSVVSTANGYDDREIAAVDLAMQHLRGEVKEDDEFRSRKKRRPAEDPKRADPEEPAD